MILLLRHLFAIAVLPFTMAVVIPIGLARRNGITPAVGSSASQVGLQVAGLLVLCLGLVLFSASLGRFVTEGRGTLAPWDPPRRLVVRGPYRYVRHPMISGVVFALLGESMVLLSMPHFYWALIFLCVNAIYIPLLEEPMLVERFGSEYRQYSRHVPRLLPRLRPWDPEEVKR